MSEQFLFIFFGWLLGILSAIVIHTIEQQMNTRRFTRATLSELNDQQFRLIMIAFTIRLRFASFDDDFIKQYCRIVESYEGPEKSDKDVEVLKKLKNQNLEVYNAFALSIDNTNTSMWIPRFSLEYFASQRSLIANCPADFQQRISGIQFHLSVLNDSVDYASKMDDKTFDQSIIGKNREAVISNLDNTYRKIGSRAEIIVNLISAIERGYNKSPE